MGLGFLKLTNRRGSVFILLVTLGGDAHGLSTAGVGVWDAVDDGGKEVTRNWFVASTGDVGGTEVKLHLV